MKIYTMRCIRLFLLILLFNSIFLFSSCSQPNADPALEQKIGQMLMIGFRGLEAGGQSPVVQDIRKRNIGGVILFDYDVPTESPIRNIKSPEQVARLTSALQQFSSIPLFIAVDQEGGRVARLKPKSGFPETRSARYLGELDNADSTRYYAEKQTALLGSLGINLNFAPVVDLNTNPDNPVIGKLNRSYSADPGIVTRHARIVIQEHLEQGIIPVLKHFPGHGSAWNDSHKGIADVTGTWKPVELNPYRNLIAHDSVPAVMTAHVFNARLDSTWPATLSKPVLTGLLRDSLNFDGLIFSDDMQMQAIRSQYGLETAIKKGINAGIDILVFANNSIFEEDIAERAINITKKLVEEGEISRDRIDRSYNRIMEIKRLFRK